MKQSRPMGVVDAERLPPEVRKDQQALARMSRAVKAFSIMDQLTELAGSYDDQAREFERAARAAQEAARLHEAAAMRAYTSARYLRSQMVDTTRLLREMAVDDLARANKLLGHKP